jgi:hypothetical protein
MAAPQPCPKKRFLSETAARMHIVAVSRNAKRGDHVPIRAYFDHRCNCWHVTSKPLRQSGQQGKRPR